MPATPRRIRWLVALMLLGACALLISVDVAARPAAPPAAAPSPESVAPARQTPLPHSS